MSPIMARINRTSARGARYYETPGGEFPSVTTILQCIAKPALVNWAATVERELVVETAARLWASLLETEPRMSTAAFTSTLLGRVGEQRAHVKALSAAGDIGRSVHALIEWNLRRELGQEAGPEPKLEPAACNSFAAYERWRQGARLEPLRIEQVVWSAEHGYAGTLDLYARLWSGDHALTVVLDWKTGKAIYPEAKLQASAYRQAMIELGHADAETWGGVVRLPKVDEPAPEVALVSPAECDALFQVFLHVKALWEWANP